MTNFEIDHFQALQRRHKHIAMSQPVTVFFVADKCRRCCEYFLSCHAKQTNKPDTHNKIHTMCKTCSSTKSCTESTSQCCPKGRSRSETSSQSCTECSPEACRCSHTCPKPRCPCSEAPCSESCACSKETCKETIIIFLLFVIHILVAPENVTSQYVIYFY